MANEWLIYKTGMEVVHDGDAEQEVRLYKVGFEVIRDLRDQYNPDFTDGSGGGVPEGFSFEAIFGAGAYGWDFVDGADDYATGGLSFGQLPFTIDDRERNPYPAHPDRDTETFIAEQQRVLRDQHNRTQAGDSTFDFGLLLKGTPDKLYTLGSLGRFYHDDYGIILARYVQFEGCVQTVKQGAPVGYLSTSRTIDWIVTNDITKSSPEQAMGVMCVAGIPEDGTYGWVVTEGAVPVPMVQDSGLIPAPETPYAWSDTGRCDIGIVGKIIGRRWGKAISPVLSAGTMYVRLEGFSPASLAELIHEEMAAFEAQVNDHETRIQAAELFITNQNVTNTGIGADIALLSQRITAEEEVRRRADASLRASIADSDWAPEIIAGDNIVRTEFANADDAIRATVSAVKFTADAAWAAISGFDPAGITAQVTALNVQVGGLSARITALILGDLADVDLVTTPPADGETIIWDAANSKWIPGASGGGGGASFMGIYGRTLATLAIGAGATGLLRLDNSTIAYNNGTFTFPATTEVLVPAGSGITHVDTYASIRNSSTTDQILLTIEWWDGAAWQPVGRHDTDTAGTDSVTVAAIGIPVVAGTSKFRFGVFTSNATTLDAAAIWSVVARGITTPAATSGTAFPGAPATGDKFFRTDRGIEYFWDGTRWLSVHLYALPFAVQAAVRPWTATETLVGGNPFAGLYSIYVERFLVASSNSATTATNYFVAQLSTRDGATTVNLGAGLSGQGNTINEWISQSETINAVVASTIDIFVAGFTETGAATVSAVASITYRLIG